MRFVFAGLLLVQLVSVDSWQVRHQIAAAHAGQVDSSFISSANDRFLLSATDTIAQCSGIDDTASLASAIAAAGPGWVIIEEGSTCASGNLTIPNLKIVKGGFLMPLSGQTVVVDRFEAGQYQTFLNTGVGTVMFHSPPATDDGKTGVIEAYPQWWGCIADYAHDCAPSLTAAINSGVRRIFLPSGGYGLASPVSIRLNNFVLEGQSRVYTDIFPMASDIHVGSGPNAMFVNQLRTCTPASSAICLPTNCIIQKLRFTSALQFNGWVFWAEDGVQGGAALFSSIIRDCWISMGSASRGFFHGGISDSFFLNNDIENTNTIFDLVGARISASTFRDNHLLGGVGPFIQSTTDASNIMTVDGLMAASQGQGYLLDIKNGKDWQVRNVTLQYEGGNGAQGGLFKFDTCVRMLASHFQATRLSGRMGGILIKDSQLKIADGFISDVWGTSDVPWALTFRGVNDADIDNVTIEKGFDGNSPQQVYFDDGTGGNVRINHCKFTKGPSRIFDGGSNVSANITLRSSEITNGQYNVGLSTVRLFELGTSGRFYVLNNVIGVDDPLATPRGDFAFFGTGDLLIDGNVFLGTNRVPVFNGGTQTARLGNNY